MYYTDICRYDQKNGPLQIVHDFEFVALNLGTGYTEIRNMSKEQRFCYVCERIKKLHNRKYGGIVLNTDFKNYMEEDEAIEFSLRAADFAKSLGMRVWIYDEQYYPSGGAGGRTLTDHPEFEALGLACVSKIVNSDGRSPIRIPSPLGHSELKFALCAPIRNGTPDYLSIKDILKFRDLSGGLAFNAPEGTYKVWCFFFRGIYEHSYMCRALRASRRYINIFNARATEAFFNETFTKGYCKHSPTDLGNTVEAVFTDEPHFPPYVEFDGVRGTEFVSHSQYDAPLPNIIAYPYIPWIEDLPELYFKEYNEDLIPSLVHIFEDTQFSRKSRCRFYSLLSSIGKNAFVDRYKTLLSGANLALTGHYYIEEYVDSHPACFGNILDHLGAMDIPGCDNLSSTPDALRHCLACKIAASAAHFAGKDQVMIEASNMIDDNRDISLTELKAAASMMFIHGITTITSYYGEDILSPEEMTEYATHVSSLKSIFDGGKYRINTLLLYPFLQLAAKTKPFASDGNFKFGEDSCELYETARCLMKNQVCFELIDTIGLSKCKITKGQLICPNGEAINTIVLPKIDWLDEETERILREADQNGIRIILSGSKIPEVSKLHTEDLLKCEMPKGEAWLTDTDPYVTFMHRSFDSYEVFMFMNTNDKSANIEVNTLDNGCDIGIVDLCAKSIEKVSCAYNGNVLKFALHLPPLKERIVVKYK